MDLITIAFRKVDPQKPDQHRVGFVSGKDWRHIHSLISEFADPNELEYTNAGIYLAVTLDVKGDDYHVSQTQTNICELRKPSSNAYELAAEPHHWRQIDWATLLSAATVHGKNVFDQTGKD